MTVEENWVDVLEKMRVSKLVKNYIVSIDEESKDLFEMTIKKINDRVTKEILGVQLVSSSVGVLNIINQEMQNFVDGIVSLVDYYVEGIYHCGKAFVRSKLKLEKQKPEQGKKYFFEHSDENFINIYKQKKLNEINVFLDQSILSHTQQYIKLKLNGRWNLDKDKDYEKIDYLQQQLTKKSIQEFVKIIDSSLLPIYEEVLEYIVKEIIVLYQRSQIQSYFNLGIDTFSIYTDDDERCCPICSVKTGKIFRIGEMLDSGGDLKDGYQHAFCKYSIEPVISYRNQHTSIHFNSAFSIRADNYSYVDASVGNINQVVKRIDLNVDGITFKQLPIEMEKRVQNLLSKLKIYYPKLIKKHNFLFDDDISNNRDWFQSIKNYYVKQGNNDFQSENMALKDQDMLTNQIASFNFENQIMISALSFDSQPIEHLILREMLRGSVKVDNKVKEMYGNKIKSKKVAHGVAIYQNSFISYLAEESEMDYLLESIIFYVTQPNKLKYVDENIFNYIDKNLENIIGESDNEM